MASVGQTNNIANSVVTEVQQFNNLLDLRIFLNGFTGKELSVINPEASDSFEIAFHDETLSDGSHVTNATLSNHTEVGQHPIRFDDDEIAEAADAYLAKHFTINPQFGSRTYHGGIYGRGERQSAYVNMIDGDLELLIEEGFLKVRFEAIQ